MEGGTEVSAETIFEGLVLLGLIVSTIVWMRPFSWESAMKEMQREFQAHNYDAKIKRRWYGWVVVHKRGKEARK